MVPAHILNKDNKLNGLVRLVQHARYGSISKTRLHGLHSHTMVSSFRCPLGTADGHQTDMQPPEIPCMRS